MSHAPDNQGSWTVEVTSPALKGFRQLPEKAAAAIVEFVTGALADNPHRLGKPLTSELLGLRTARRGDYRVLFTLDVEEQILYVHRIEHRSTAFTSPADPSLDLVTPQLEHRSGRTQLTKGQSSANENGLGSSISLFRPCHG